MARSHARILTTIWRGDFAMRSAQAQRAYILILSQPELNFAGVIAYTPRRWARLAPNTPADRIEKAVDELEEHRYVVVDRDTEELWVRSFVRHDAGIMSSPNLLKAMWKDYETVASEVIRERFLKEYEELAANPFGKGSGKGSAKGSGTNTNTTSTKTPARSKANGNHAKEPNGTAALPPGFTEFWQVYPAKKGKPAAVKAYKAALGRASAEVILEGATRYRDDPERKPSFTKWPQGWLNEDRWSDQTEVDPEDEFLRSDLARGQ